jgi:Leucine-rich repeat (LRR) protein
MTPPFDNNEPHLIVRKTRVRDIDGFCGTVEYLGPVASAKNENEIYAGIGWDDPSRGKHDGSVICRKTKQLVRHFSSKGGSFLRLSKVDTGIPLDLPVIQSKYVEPDAPLVAPNNILPHSARTSSGREKPIEFHGEIKLRDRQQVELLSRIALRNMGISSVAPNMCGLELVVDLDLGGNLLCDWSIMSSLQAFPNLASLSLASNRLGDLEETPRFKNSRLSLLNVHSCGIKSFMTIQRLDEAFPGIEQLCVAGNDLSDLTAVEAVCGFQALTRLDMSSCKLATWGDHVRKLSALPSLETLLINFNEVDSIPAKIENGSFQHLQNLYLTGVLVSDWVDVQGLSSLPSFRSLALRNTPLTASMGTAEARFVIISRFPNLEIVNSSPISAKERSEAEKRYVTHVSQELLLADKSEINKEDFLATNHPQFTRLAEKFHQEMKRQGQVVTGQTVSSYAVNVTITSLASDSCTMEPIHKRLPSSLTVGRLKALCVRAFGLDFDLQVLHCRAEVRENTLLSNLSR